MLNNPDEFLKRSRSDKLILNISLSSNDSVAGDRYEHKVVYLEFENAA